MLNVSIIGGSGYGGGELLRLLLGHPQVQVQQVTSRAHLGEFVYQVHPNLRKRTTLKFCDPAQWNPPISCFWHCRTVRCKRKLTITPNWPPRLLTSPPISV